MQALAQAMWIGRTAGGAVARLLPPGEQVLPLLGQSAPARRYSGAVGAPVQGLGQLGKRRRRRAGKRQITWEAADRVAREQWVDANMDDLAFPLRRIQAGYPWNIALEDEDRGRAIQKRGRIVAQMAWMFCREAEVARAVLDDGDREALCQICERPDRGRIAARAGRDDERVLGRRENSSGVLYRAFVGGGRGGSHAARRRIVGEPRQRRRQHLAR